MSNTIAHRPHVHHHVPLTPVLAVLVTVLIAAALIWAINLPDATTTTSSTEAVPVPSAGPAFVAAPESPVFRHALMRAGMTGGYERAYIVNLHHLVEGTTLDPVSTQPYTGTSAAPSPNYARAAHGR
jgi:hypothetical protein